MTSNIFDEPIDTVRAACEQRVTAPERGRDAELTRLGLGS